MVQSFSVMLLKRNGMSMPLHVIRLQHGIMSPVTWSQMHG